MPEWRVLVVDDDTHMLDLMTRRLSRMGLQADRAQDGRTAVSMVQTTAYDLILTDIYMPEGTGLEILRTAKENDPHVQVIVVTGSATLDNAVEALNMGAFSYLSKPFDHMSVFDNAVSRALEFRRLIRDNQRLAEIQRRRGDMLEAEVTDRIRQMRRRQQDMIDLLARLPEGVLVVDGEGRILLSNAPAEEWLAREARLEVQPLRRYLSMLVPPRRPTTSETEIDGVYLRLTAQPLPPEEGKPRTLVTIGEASDEGAEVRRKLSESLADLKPGLDWLARRGLDEKETDVVRGLLTQIAEVETMLGPAADDSRARRTPEVKWKEIGLDERKAPEPAEPPAREPAERPRRAGKGQAPPGPAKPPWPPPRAGEERQRGLGASRKLAPVARHKEPDEAKEFETILLSDETSDMVPPAERPAAPVPPPERPDERPPASAPGIEEGLERLLKHLAETPVPEDAAFPAIKAEVEDLAPELPKAAAPPQVPEVKEIPKPPRRSSGLLSKVRREGKPKEAPSEPSQPPLERIFRPVLEAAPAVPPTASAPPPPAPKAEKPQAELPSVPQPVPTPPPERASGLLGKMRRSSRQARPSAEAQPTVEKPPTVKPDEAERHVHTPIPAQPEPREKDLSALLDAVREAAETGRLREQTPTEPIAAEEPPEPAPKPTAEKRPPVWPPPRPSESDED